MSATNYPDGFYTVQNKNGVYTEMEVKRGLVYVRGGFAGGQTGQTLEYFETGGLIVLPFVIVPVGYACLEEVTK